MGHDNVFIWLALAKQQLGEAGITKPTPQQLQAALTGGSRSGIGIVTGSGKGSGNGYAYGTDRGTIGYRFRSIGVFGRNRVRRQQPSGHGKGVNK
jgi:hypothetical protein